MEEEFEPKIVCFACNWCSYAGADLAGVSRFQYPPNVRIIRVMCSGRVDPIFVLKAFKKGADGVIISGCHPQDCHYINGNDKTKIRAEFLKYLLKEIRIEEERFRLEWISGSEGEKFAKVIKEMTFELKQLKKFRDGKRLEAGINLLEQERLRWLIGKKGKLTKEGNVYGNLINENRYDVVVKNAISSELERNLILNELRKGEKTAKELAELTALPINSVIKQLIALKKLRRVDFSGMKEISPSYKVVV